MDYFQGISVLVLNDFLKGASFFHLGHNASVAVAVRLLQVYLNIFLPEWILTQMNKSGGWPRGQLQYWPKSYALMQHFSSNLNIMVNSFAANYILLVYEYS